MFMSQRSGIFYNLINNPIIYKVIQKVMSGTSLRANLIKENIKKKKFKNFGHRLWTCGDIRKYS